MLSLGKPPPGPPCPCDELIPPLNSDERASPSPQLPDLSHNHSVPNFSIRNYVFAARNQNISTNWPFTMENLQLCLKHGVKDPLPPFQSIDNVRNQPFLRSSVKSSSSVRDEISGSNSTAEPLRLNSDEDKTRSHDEQSVKDFPSTMSHVYQHKTEPIITRRQLNGNTVSVNPSISADKEVAGPSVSWKTETAIQSAGKKGRLVVKLGRNLGRSSTEYLASTGAALSETMASKVCPVCKIFSSSSNTTLNAHIDQCLSEEPTPKWSAGSKLIRRRMKPRKTRLMVDIYETACQCTLEDLDRRNGSNWATGMSLTSQDDVDEKRQRVSPVNPGGDVGAVYIDSNGTKLRILSRFSDSPPSSSMTGEPLRPRKCFKRNRNKVLSKKKRRKKKAQKHLGYLKHVSQGKDFRSHKARLHSSQDFCGQEKYHRLKGDSMDGHLMVSRSQGPLRTGYDRTLEQRVCSKMSCAPKKVTEKDHHPPFQCTLHVARDLLIEGGRSYSIKNLISNENYSDSFVNQRNSESMGVPVTKGDSPRKRKLGSRLFNGLAGSNMDGSNLLMMGQTDNRTLDPLKFTEDCAFHDSNKLSIPPAAHGRSSKTKSLVISPTSAIRFSRMEKQVLSVCSARTSKLHGAIEGSTARQSKICLVEEANEGDRGEDSDPSHTAETTNGTSPVGSFMGSFGQDTGNQEPQYCDNDEEKNAESVNLSNNQLEKLAGIDYAVNKGQDHGDDNIIGTFKLQSKLGTDDNALNFRKYLNLGTPIENRRILDQTPTETYNGSLCHIDDPFPGIIEEDTGYGTNQQGSDVNMDPGTRVQQDYEVERILIPGPPGSFLPSPRACILEEFQGNSSLTTSQVLSSQEQQDLVNRDFSDSPISAMSTISDSLPAGSDMKCVGSAVFVGHHEALKGKASLDSSGGGNGIELFASNAALTPQPSTMRVSSERSIEKGPLLLKNDDQPCRCQQKERSSQGIVPNYLESQLLRRRNIGSLAAIELGKCLNQSPTSIQVEGRFEVLPQSAPQDTESEWDRLSAVAANPKFSGDNGPKVSDCGNSESATPSVCNPVLRLMGKNLMVINKDNASTPLGHLQPSDAWSNNATSSHVSGLTSVSYGSIPISSSGRQPALDNKLKMAMEPPVAPTSMSTNWHIQEYTNSTFSFPDQSSRSNVVVSNSRDSRPMKETIIIDDTLEDEITNVAANAVRGGGFSRERQASVAPAVSLPMKTAVTYEPGLVGTLPFNYSSQNASFFSQVPVLRQAGSGPVRVQWCSSLEGPGAFLQSHLVSGPSTNIHIHSPLPSASNLPSQISLG